MIGQQISLRYLIPRAITILEANPLAEGDMYPSDLLSAVLHTDKTYWRERRAMAGGTGNRTRTLARNPNRASAVEAQAPKPDVPALPEPERRYGPPTPLRIRDQLPRLLYLALFAGIAGFSNGLLTTIRDSREGWRGCSLRVG